MGLLTVPSSYTPRKGGKRYPKERPYLLSPAEVRLVKKATDGKADKTPFRGLLSLADDSASANGVSRGDNYGTKGSGSTKTANGSVSNKSSSYNGSSSTSRDRQDGSGETGASRGGGGNTNTGNTGTGGAYNVGRGGSGVGGGLGYGADPAQGAITGTGGANAGAIARAVGGLLGGKAPNSLPGNSNPAMNYGYGTPGNPVPALNNRNPLPGNSDPNIQYGSGTVNRVPTAGVPAGQKVTDVFGPTYPQDPSIAGRLKGPVAPGYHVTDVFGPNYSQDPAIAGQNQTALSQRSYNVPQFKMDANGKLSINKMQDRLAAEQPYGPRDPAYADTYAMDNLTMNPPGNPFNEGSYMNGKTITDRVKEQARLPQTAQNDAQFPTGRTGPSYGRGGTYGLQPSNSNQSLASIDPANYNPTGSIGGGAPVNINPDYQRQQADMTRQLNLQQQMDTTNPDAPPKQDIYAHQGKIQQIASKIANFLPGGSGSAGMARSRQDGSNNDTLYRPFTEGQNPYPPGTGAAKKWDKDHPKTSTTPVTPPVTPPVNPATNPIPWYYPQYTQAWANLPTGRGG